MVDGLPFAICYLLSAICYLRYAFIQNFTQLVRCNSTRKRYQMRGALVTTIHRAEFGDRNVRARVRAQTVTPFTFHCARRVGKNNSAQRGMFAQVINVPMRAFIFSRVPRNSRSQATCAERAADINVIAARKMERPQFSDA